MRKFTMITTALLVALTASSTTFADKDPLEKGKTDAYITTDVYGYSIFKHLNLTTQQRQEMRELRKKAASNHKDTIQEYRATVYKLMTATSFDEAAARDVVSKMDSVRVDELKLHNQIYNLLTPEQKKAYQQEYQSMQAKRERKLQEHEMKKVAPKG